MCARRGKLGSTDTNNREEMDIGRVRELACIWYIHFVCGKQPLSIVLGAGYIELNTT